MAGMSRHGSIVGQIQYVLGWLDSIPYAFIAIPLRLAVADVFWRSAMTKLPSWDMTLALFAQEYKVPLISSEVAAYLSIGLEISCPILLVLGLLTRFAAFLLLGMTAVIEIFVYPEAWPTHIQWAAMLFVLLARGGGGLSVDHWLRRHLIVND